MFREAPLPLRLLQRARPYNSPLKGLLDLLWDLLPEGGDVLDIGCGAGLLLGLLARRGWVGHEVGVDNDAKRIAAAQRMACGLTASSQLEFRRCGSTDEWPRERFSAVLFVDVLHHIRPENQKHAFLEAAARVAPGGVFIYKDMSTQPSWMAAANRLHDWLIAGERIYYIPVDRVEEWAVATGLAPEHAWAGTKLWYSHELRVFRKLIP